MFIVWGKKIVRRKLGYVADFCPLCRQARCFVLQRVGLAEHVYYVTAGKGELVGYERRCCSCATAVETELERYTAPAKRLAPLPELQRATFPNLEQVCAKQLALEQQIRNDLASLGAADRLVLIRNSILLLSPRVEQRYASSDMDKGVVAALIGAALLLALGPVLASALSLDDPVYPMMAGLTAAVVLLWWQVAMARRRFLQREIVPALATALRPLRPAQSEIERVMAELKQLNHKIGVKLKAAEVVAGLDTRAA